MPGAAGLLICTLMSDISWGSSDLTITVFTWPNWCPPMYFRVTPGGHASVPVSPQRWQNSAQQPNRSDETSISFWYVHIQKGCLYCNLHAKVSINQTCVLYSPGLCEGGIWRNRFSFANCHVFDKGHGRCVGNGTFKVVICTNSSLQVPVSKTKIRFLFNRH